ncbi:hypothetical protein JCM8202_005475 [Rhodotorula sphaerocarpa]
MPLKLLPHKSWHVYNQENVARVRRDEARAQQEQEQTEDRAFRADAEARLDRLRNKSAGKKRRRDQQDEGEKELDRQLAGEGRGRDTGEADDPEGGEPHAQAIIVRPEGWTAEGGPAKPPAVPPMTTNGHLNFWAELEAGIQAPASTLEKRLNKVLAEEPDDSLTKVYLAKKGEGEPKGWYASADGKTDRERKEPVETTLERTYRDNESKRLDDPLAVMNSYLKHRSDIKSGKPPPTPRAPSSRDRYLEPTQRGRLSDDCDFSASRRRSSGISGWDDTPRSSWSGTTGGGGGNSSMPAAGEFEPFVPRLLPPKHKRGPRSGPGPASGPSHPSSAITTASAAAAAAPSSSARQLDPTHEASERVTSERARAAALLASRRRAAAALSNGGGTPGGSSPAWSEGGASRAGTPGGGGGWGMYNREEVLAARNGRQHHHRDGGGAVAWGERRDRRQERERHAWRGGN